MLLAVIPLYSQRATDYSANRDSLLQKSKNQNTTGWVLLGAGTAITVVGAIGFNNNFVLLGEGGDDQKTDTYGFILLTGLVMDLASIPFFISASKNRRRALTVHIDHQYLNFPRNDLQAYQKISVPSVTLNINF